LTLIQPTMCYTTR